MASLDSLAVAITTCFVCIRALAVWIDDKTGSQSVSDSLLHVLHIFRTALRTVIYSVAILSYGKVFTRKASGYLVPTQQKSFKYVFCCFSFYATSRALFYTHL